MIKIFDAIAAGLTRIGNAVFPPQPPVNMQLSPNHATHVIIVQRAPYSNTRKAYRKHYQSEEALRWVQQRNLPILFRVVNIGDCVAGMRAHVIITAEGPQTSQEEKWFNLELKTRAMPGTLFLGETEWIR